MSDDELNRVIGPILQAYEDEDEKRFDDARDRLRQVIDEAVRAEREACAKVADDEANAFIAKAGDNDGRESDFAFGSVNSGQRIAAAIRNRSDNP